MKPSLFFVLIFFLTIQARLTAQMVSVGVIGGAPFTSEVSGPTAAPPYSLCTEGCKDNATRYTVGPSVRVKLPLNLRIEVDALYRPYGFNSYGGDGFFAAVSGQQWRFPVLLQHPFGTRLLQPFVEGGVSFEHLVNLQGASGATVPDHSSTTGLVFGAGVDLHLAVFRISGELRYTREFDSYFNNASNLNQAEVLFGVRF
jgi:hypothetical protein